MRWFKRWNNHVYYTALISVAVLPCLLTFWAVARYGVDISYADEWTFAPFLEKARAGTFAFADLWEQHNEHRYLFPRLLFIAFAEFAAGNLRAQMLFSVILVALTSFNLFVILRRSFGQSRTKLLLLSAFANLLLFSPVQSENWTWGFQFVLFGVNFLLTAGVAIAGSSLPIATKFISCVALAIISTYSFGNGAALWFTTFPFALLSQRELSRKQILAWSGAWLIAAIFAVGFYFVSYVKPPHHPGVGSGNLRAYYLYISTFLGGHFWRAARAESIVVPVFIGTVLLSVYAGGVWITIVRPRLRRATAPWLALGGFALLSAGVTCVARVGFGPHQALDSRYTSFSLYLSLAAVCLYLIAKQEFRGSGTGMRWRTMVLPRLEGAGLAIFALCYVISATWGVKTMQETERCRLWGKAALLFGNVLDSGVVYESYLGGNAHDVLMFANIQDRLGLMHPPLFKSARVAELPTVPIGTPRLGHLDRGTNLGDQYTVEGWAVLPNKKRVADCVAIAYADETNGPTLFRVSHEVFGRPDVARTMKRRHLLGSGWRVRFPVSAVPAGDREISAWAVDAKTGTLYELANRPKLPFRNTDLP